MKLFELYAELGLDSSKFSSGVKNASAQGSSLASSLKSSIGGAATYVTNQVSASTIALGNLLADAAITTLRVGTDLVKAIFEEYADAEQLYGGVETIFKDSANAVKKNAEEAFMNAGMSANEYMETVTSFSSSLLQGLGGDTEAAAKYADIAIRDMADNANKFGTNIGLIQNAYQGFAKDNYTMLDNLKLGYGGTQEEMARLINDSGVLGHTIVTAANVSKVPLHRMFEAIHVIQEEMGVAGTTAKEASETISGSASAFQAAWKNLISGFADDKDMDRLVDNVFETGENLARNIFKVVPRIGQNVLEAADSFLSRWDLWGSIKESFKEDGILGALETIGGAVWGKLQEWGPIGLDAGSALIANIASGITGNTVSKDDIKKSITDIWTGISESASIVWNTAGEIYTKVKAELDADSGTGSEISSTIAAVFSAGATGIDGLLTASGSLFSNIYKAITGDAEGAEKIKALLSGAGDSAGSWVQETGEAVESSADAIMTSAQKMQSAIDYARGVNELFPASGASSAPPSSDAPTTEEILTKQNAQMTEFAKSALDVLNPFNIPQNLPKLFSPLLDVSTDITTDIITGVADRVSENRIEEKYGLGGGGTRFPEEGESSNATDWTEVRYGVGGAISTPRSEYFVPDPQTAALFEDLGDLETYWSDGAEEVGNAIIDAADQVQKESREMRESEENRFRDEGGESGETDDVAALVASVSALTNALTSMPAEVAAAAQEGCAAGVSGISITGHVSTGNVVLSNGLLVGALTPQLNLALGKSRVAR